MAKESEAEMSLKLLLPALLLVNLSCEVDAGTTFTQLSKSVEIVDMDKWMKAKLEAEEYARKQGAMIFTSSTTITRMRP